MFLREIDRIFEADIACLFEDFRVFRVEVSRFLVSHWIDSFEKVPDDMEFIGYQACLGQRALERFDIGHTHITTHSPDSPTLFRTDRSYEFSESYPCPWLFGAQPQKSFSRQSIGLDVKHLTAATGDLNYLHVEQIPDIPVSQRVTDNALDSFGYGVAVGPVEGNNNLQGGLPGPCVKHYAQVDIKRAFAFALWNLFNHDSTSRVLHSPRSLGERHADSLQGNKFPTPFFEAVITGTFGFATRADRRGSFARNETDFGVAICLQHFADRMPLEANSLFGYTSHDQESFPPFNGTCVRSFVCMGFDLCIQITNF